MTLLLMTLANAPTLADSDKARASGDFTVCRQRTFMSHMSRADLGHGSEQIMTLLLMT